MGDESGQKKVDETVEALEDEQPTQEFEHQVSGEDWHGDAADQACRGQPGEHIAHGL